MPQLKSHCQACQRIALGENSATIKLSERLGKETDGPSELGDACEWSFAYRGFAYQCILDWLSMLAPSAINADGRQYLVKRQIAFGRWTLL